MASTPSVSADVSFVKDELVRTVGEEGAVRFLADWRAAATPPQPACPRASFEALLKAGRKNGTSRPTVMTANDDGLDLEGLDRKGQDGRGRRVARLE